MSLPTRCLGLIVVLVVAGQAAGQNGLLPLVRKEKPSITDLVLIYQGGTHRIPWKTEHFAPYVSHVDPKTMKEEWLFDGYLFIEFKDNLGQQYMNNLRERNNARKEHWSWLLDRQFEAGTGLAALDETCDQVVKRIGKPARPRQVVLVVPTPIDGQRDWGDFDGAALDFRRQQDRANAAAWYMNSALDRWKKLAPKHLELAGFYWLMEYVNPNDKIIIPPLAKFVHDRKLHFFWIPSWDPQAGPNWKALGFDMAWQQPNHFQRLQVPDSRIDQASQFAARHGMGVQWEFDSRMINDRATFLPRFGVYHDAFMRNGVAQNASMAYYEGGGTVFRLSVSKDAELRGCYDQLARFITARQRRAEKMLAE